MAPPTACAVILFALASITGCSMAHGDPQHPKKNPHPVQRYEVIATADAPGPWDSVHGYIDYKVTNPDCTPKNEFLGVHALPPIVGMRIEMVRTGETTWKGYFYRDAMLNEDYYGLGACRWDAVSVGAAFVVHGETFGAGTVLVNGVQPGSPTEYFKNSDFDDRLRDEAYGTAPDDPEVVSRRDAFFPITVVVRKTAP